MSHNAKSYRKKINKSASDGCQKIDILFKQSILSSAQDSTCGKSLPSDDNGKNEANTIGDSHMSESAVDHQSQACIDDYYSEDDSENYSEDENSECIADARKFHSGKYEARFTWLYYSYSKAGYCCKLCEIFCPVLLHNKAPNPFVSAACEREGFAKSSNLKPTVYTLLTEGVLKQNKEEILRNRRYFSTLVKTVFFVVQKRWALDSVSDVMDHMEAMGTDDVTQYLQYHPNLKYTSSQSVSDIVKEINNVLESDLLDALRKADSYALLADESSDESHREQFAIIARFKKEGIVDDFFLGIIEVKRTDAASLMAAIEEFLRAKNIDITKAAFVGFDGCNTMSGENKGLQRRFRHIVPHQLYINCRNHKLALCVKHLIKSFPVVQVVDELLIGLWKMFHYSPKKFATLQEVQTSYGLTHLKLIKACSTRWLSHGKACIRLVERFVQTQIDALAQHYGNTREDVFQGHRNVSEPRYTEATYRSEFNNFKFQLCLLRQSGKGDAASLFQDPVFVNSFPAMNHLVSLSELVPSSTASVERLFSLMNSLCTPSRNRLSQEKLDGLIRICLNDTQLTVCTVTRIID